MTFIFIENEPRKSSEKIKIDDVDAQKGKIKIIPSKPFMATNIRRKKTI